VATLCLLFLTQGIFAQSKSDRIFDTFRNKPGVSYFAITKDMKDAFNIDLKDQEKLIKGDLSEIRLLAYNPIKGNLTSGEFLKKATNLLPAASYQHLKADDQDSDAEIWMLGNKKKASEFHIFIANEERDGRYFLISFYGDFLVDDAESIREVGAHLSVDF
jgi:sulfur transfer complex TusBCD TusB component (DsrH family)